MSLLRRAWVLAVVPALLLGACGIVLESSEESPSADSGTSSGQASTSSGGASSSGAVSSSSGAASSSSSGAVSSGGASSGCAPQTCGASGRQCGIADDGCGGVLDCGGCTTPTETCVEGQCVCPDVPQNACAGRCGVITNECGNTRDCNLASCGAGLVCNVGNGICECPQVPPVDCAGKCGQVANACGNVLECGGCQGNETCTNNTCQCTPEPRDTTCDKTIANKTVCGIVKNNCNVDVDCTETCPANFMCRDCDGNGNGVEKCCR